MNVWFKWRRTVTVPWLMFALAFSMETWGQAVSHRSSLELQVGAAEQVSLNAGTGGGFRWKSSAPQIAQAFQNGFVVGLRPGQARVTREAGATEAAECLITVEGGHPSLLDPAALKQYPDNREFMIGNRKCYGSELNGQRASDPDEKRFTRTNRVINPAPLRGDKPLDWELQPGTEVYDGAGVLMGTVPSTLEIGARRVSWISTS